MTRGVPIHYAPLSNASEPCLSGGSPADLTAQRPLDTGFAMRFKDHTADSTSDGTSDAIATTYVAHASGLRTNTDIVLAEKIRSTYPNLAVTIVPAGLTDLLSYAEAGHAEAIPQEDSSSSLGLSHSWKQYIPPAKRINNSPGLVATRLFFGKFLYKWEPAPGRDTVELLIYIADCRDGTQSFPQYMNHYILTAPGQQHLVDELVLQSGLWFQQLRGEIWVFDQGWWEKSADLWNSVKHAKWEDVILEDSMKAGIRADVEGFFDARETYDKLKVPWKRGIIFYGPPGNGKTISIKAMMHSLYERKGDPIPTLYVRSLKSIFGGEYSISAIFIKARQQAPCYLVFEDLDSLVTDQLRSYFLNEVDGLKSNDGILMVGSTNHLDRLDPGISKRPSRFDRKYLFPNPDLSQREAYCRYWQGKLKGNDDVEFPDELVGAIAGITGGFSFAYMQEAFVASLLAIAREQRAQDEEGKEDPLNRYILWREIKRQVQALREGLEEEGGRGKQSQKTAAS